MAYALPVFNLICGVWRYAANPATDPPDDTFTCNLAFGRRAQVPSTGGTSAVGIPLAPMYLLLPPFSDIRDDPTLAQADQVQVPFGTSRMYRVFFVDDAGKGFSNEHRVAELTPVYPRSFPLP